MYIKTITTLLRLRKTPHYFRSPFPYACATKVSSAPLSPITIDLPRMLVIMSPIPTPAIIYALLMLAEKCPINTIFIIGYNYSAKKHKMPGTAWCKTKNTIWV